MDTSMINIKVGFSFYVLEDGVPRAVGFSGWAQFFEDHNKRVIATTTVGDVYVSTVFLGVGNALFETMIFGGPYDQQAHRDATLADARRTHDLTVAELRTKQVLLPAP